MPRVSATPDVADKVRRLKELSKDVVRTRDEHRRYTSEVAQIAIELKDRLDYGQYQAVMRECGFNLKTLEKWVLGYRRSIGEAPPRQPREGHLEKVSPSESRNSLSLQGSAGTTFDPDAEADAEDDAAWNASGLEHDDDDDLDNFPDDDEAAAASVGSCKPPHGTGDAMLLVNSGGTTVGDMTHPPRVMSSAAPAAIPVRRSGATYTAAMRAQQLTLDELYLAAEREAQQLMQMIHERALTGDQIAEFRAYFTRLTAGEAS